jgi:hypothetical protein
VGWIIDRFPPSPSGGYSPEAYRYAFAIVLAGQLAALAWFWINRRRLREAEARFRPAR